MTARSAGAAGEAGPVCSPGCDDSMPQRGQGPQAVGRRPPGRVGRSHKGHRSRVRSSTQARRKRWVAGVGAWSGAPCSCEWEQGQRPLGPPGARNSPYGRPACVPTSQEALGARPGAATTQAGFWKADRLGTGRGAPRGRAGGGWGPAVSSQRLLLRAFPACGLGRTAAWNIHGSPEWEGLTAFWGSRGGGWMLSTSTGFEM